MQSSATQAQLKVLISREQIARRVTELAEQITRDYQGEQILFVGVLKGASIFLSDLARQVNLDATFDFISVSSYGSSTRSSGEVKLNKDVDQSLEGKNVIIVEDILDTGLTLSFLLKQFQNHKPKSLKIAALLDKVSRRITDVHGDYVGFEIPDEFVVGYGLDYAERYRNLPDVCVLSQ
ncbi:MAG TPA: hypoxanthine phosphoribosyltransferase [Terriglobales bacterium]|nr:hypoxanthine phosphoribosyltransferase [Terriglobales bacterium]